jgi:serralysin
VRIYHNPFSEADGFSAQAFDLPVISFSLSASPAASALLSSQIADTTGMEFSALHSATCCACGQNHQTLKFYLAQTESDGGGATVAQSSGTIYSGGEVPGDTSTTETLAVGDSVTDTIEVSGDQDWFAVNLIAGQRYLITLTGTGADPLDDPYLEVMDSNGNQVRFNDDSGDGLNSSLYFVPETSGTYYVNAHGWEDDQGNTSTGEYTITLEKAEDIGTYTFDEIANFITQEFDTPHRWADTDLTYDVSGLSAGAQILAIRALETWADLTNLTFTEDTGNADITFQNTESGAFASTSYGGTDSEGYYIITSSTVNVAADWFGGDVSLDSYTYQTFLHEIGHALGLGHAGPYNSSATYGQDNIYINDNWSYSLMSYFDQLEAGFGNYRFALGPQIADILAIHTLYEVNPDGTRTGNTTYGFNSTESDINDWSQFVVVQPEGTYLRPPSYAIYDTGGTDTIDLSGYTRDQELSLVQETFSSLGDRPDNSNPTYTNSVSIARGTIIENAIGGSGNDTIIGNSANNHIIGNNGNDRLFGNNGQDNLDGGFGIDNLRGGDGNDDLYGGTGNDHLMGDRGRDTLYGGADNDHLEGNLGNDVLYGEGGNDHIEGGSGRDGLRGDEGDDLLEGGSGRDTLRGGDGKDLLYGGTDNDNLIGGQGSDVLYGEDGDDTLTSGSGRDGLRGDIGDDTLNGGNGKDTLRGGNGSDLLLGDKGNDKLIGGSGNDTLNGGADDDQMTGGSGADIFQYESATGGQDVIEDFNTGTDTLQLINTGITNFAGLQSNMLQDGADTLITIQSGHTIRLVGVLPNQISSGDVEIITSAEPKSGDKFDFRAVAADEGTGKLGQTDIIVDFEQDTSQVQLVDSGFTSFTQVQSAIVEFIKSSVHYSDDISVLDTFDFSDLARGSLALGIVGWDANGFATISPDEGLAPAPVAETGVFQYDRDKSDDGHSPWDHAPIDGWDLVS